MTEDIRELDPEYIPKSFSREVHEEAFSLGGDLDRIMQGRRLVTGITIDDPESRDLDDAMWLSINAAGQTVINASIADVPAVVPIGSLVDREAGRRGFTIYRVHDSTPMLPRILSENRLSLIPRKLRPTITISTTLDENFNIVDIQIEQTALRSRRRLSYEEANYYLERGNGREVAKVLRKFGEIASGLRANRGISRHTDRFEERSGHLLRKSNGHRSSEESTRAHRIVEEIMILTNRAVAQFAGNHDIPILYRNFRSSGEAAPEAQVETHDAVERAFYEDVNRGHGALGVRTYTHGTSPIRRGVDRINLAQIEAHLRGEEYPYSVAAIQEMVAFFNGRVEFLIGLTNGHRRRKYSFNLGEADSVESILALEIQRFESFLRRLKNEKTLSKVHREGIKAYIRSGQIKTAVTYHQILFEIPEDQEIINLALDTLENSTHLAAYLVNVIHRHGPEDLKGLSVDAWKENRGNTTRVVLYREAQRWSVSDSKSQDKSTIKRRAIIAFLRAYFKGELIADSLEI